MGWAILIAILMLLWIAAMQPVWLRIAFAPGRSEIQVKYLWMRFRPSGAPSPRSPVNSEISVVGIQAKTTAFDRLIEMIPSAIDKFGAKKENGKSES